MQQELDRPGNISSGFVAGATGLGDSDRTPELGLIPPELVPQLANVVAGLETEGGRLAYGGLVGHRYVSSEAVKLMIKGKKVGSATSRRPGPSSTQSGSVLSPNAVIAAGDCTRTAGRTRPYGSLCITWRCSRLHSHGATGSGSRQSPAFRVRATSSASAYRIRSSGNCSRAYCRYHHAIPVLTCSKFASTVRGHVGVPLHPASNGATHSLATVRP